MKKASKRIVISSERKNVYGFKVLTEGIDLSDYSNNPVMLWMHKRNEGNKGDVLPLGYFEDLRMEDDTQLGRVLTGLPVFDDTDDFALSVYNKHENGTVKMASAGLINPEWGHDENGDLAVLKSKLQEVSIVDIGANPDALAVVLYNEQNQIIQLSASYINEQIINKNQNTTNMNKIELSAEKAAVLLGVTTLNGTEEFETKVMGIVQLAAQQKTQIEALSRDKSELAEKVNQMEAAKKSAEVDVYLSAKVAEKRITEQEKANFVKLAATDFETVKNLIESRAEYVPVSVRLASATSATNDRYAGKTYKELDKANLLVQLKSDNLPLFRQLFKEEFKAEYNG